MADEVQVSGYTRKKGGPKSKHKKSDSLDGTGIEVPHIAPVQGDGIFLVPKAGEPRKASSKGVTIMGGSQAGQRATPEIKHGKRS